MNEQITIVITQEYDMIRGEAFWQGKRTSSVRILNPDLVKLGEREKEIAFGSVANDLIGHFFENKDK